MTASSERTQTGRRQVLELLYWQCCSILLTLTQYCSTKLVDRGIDAPTAQSLAAYALLSLHWVPLCVRRARQRKALSERRDGVDGDGATDSTDAEPAPSLRPWQWLLLAAADVEGNYLLVLAFQCTDITSVSLLDAFVVPMTMILSRGFFGARYGPRQLFAAAICVGGLAVLLVSDMMHRGSDGTAAGGGGDDPARWCTSPLLGDLLVLLGSSLYALSNVCQQYLVQHTFDRTEYLAHLGMYGLLLASVQCALLERDNLAATASTVSAAAASGLSPLLVRARSYPPRPAQPLHILRSARAPRRPTTSPRSPQLPSAPPHRRSCSGSSSRTWSPSLSSTSSSPRCCSGAPPPQR